MNSQPDCIFCRIVAGQAPYHEVWSDRNHLAFLSIFPNTQGVTVVIPKNHHTSYIFEQSDQVVCDLMLAVKKVAQKLDAYFEDVNRCGLVFEGFGVDHLHAKLYPLHGTSSLNQWQPIESKKMNTYFEHYPGYISSNDSVRADDQKLAELAQKIKNK